MAKSSSLRRIATLTDRIEELQRERELAVARALSMGGTWAQIARALGCSPQAAHKRYRWVRYDETTATVWQERPLPNAGRTRASR